MKSREDAIGTAVQIAFEYPEFTCEHISDMYDTFERRERPCTFDELADLCAVAKRLKNEGMKYHAAIEFMSK